MSALACGKGRAWIEVDLDAIRSNLHALRALATPTTHVMAVVKADAYGHGLVPTATAALDGGASWVGVAAVAEGVALREAGIEAPILLLCALAPCEIAQALAYRLTLTLGDEEGLRALIPLATGHDVEVHIEVDTGIGRAGVQPHNAVALWRQATAAGLRVTGLMTHFAEADSPDPESTQHQGDVFSTVRRAMHRAGARFDWVHLNNSAAIVGCADRTGNMIRPGILLYGVSPSNGLDRALPPKGPEPAASFLLPPSPHPFRPALALYARVGSVRSLAKGHPISYGCTHRLVRNSRVATVLIGYGDGYPRRLSNRGHMLLNGQRAPILGRVCMDQTVVDVTEIPGVAPGDIAVCIGEQQGAVLTANTLAAFTDTTEHELTTCLSPRLPRHYLGLTTRPTA